MKQLVLVVLVLLTVAAAVTRAPGFTAVAQFDSDGALVSVVTVPDVPASQR